MSHWSRLKTLKLNTLTSLTLQLTQIGCGFVVPWLILHHYGSSVNGLVNSVTQFLTLIAFLEVGIGPVLQASLYKPLCEHDNRSIGVILRCAQSFYNKIGYILIVYTVILIGSFPYITDYQFDIFYTGTLIFSIFISSLAQYFFGIVNSLFLNTAQKGYVVNVVSIVAVIVSTITGYILIKAGQSIQLVKLASSLVFLLRPLGFWLYIKSHYSIPKDVPLVSNALRQKWNGVMQHIASVVIDFAPIVTLSVFTDFRVVSVFSVYNIVLSGLKNLFFCLFGGFWPLMGELYAKKETSKLNSFVDLTAWISHTGTTIIFSITALTIVPFVRVYTSGIGDVNYCVPVFAFLFTLNIALQCYKLPYVRLIQIAGHFRETQYRYLFSAVIALVSTVIGVRYIGINGAVVGIIFTLIYQLLWMFNYDKNQLVKTFSWLSLAKQLSVDFITFLLILLLDQFISDNVMNYTTWILFAFEISIASVVVSLLVNVLCYRANIKYLCQLLFRK